MTRTLLLICLLAFALSIQAKKHSKYYDEKHEDEHHDEEDHYDPYALKRAKVGLKGALIGKKIGAVAAKKYLVAHKIGAVAAKKHYIADKVLGYPYYPYAYGYGGHHYGNDKHKGL